MENLAWQAWGKHLKNETFHLWIICFSPRLEKHETCDSKDFILA